MKSQAFVEFLQRHVRSRHGHPEPPPPAGGVGDVVYKDWLLVQLRCSADTLDRWFDGKTVPWKKDAPWIVAALGYRQGSPEEATALHELTAILVAARAAGAGLPPLAAAHTAPPPAATPAPPPAAEAPDGSRRAYQRALDALGHPPGALFLHELFRAVDSHAHVGAGHPDSAAIEDIVKRVLRKRQGNPCTVVTGALAKVRKLELEQRAPLDAAVVSACRVASTHLMVLALYQYANTDYADFGTAERQLLFVRTKEAMKAALLLEESLGGVLDFIATPAPDGALPPAGARPGTALEPSPHRPLARPRYYVTEGDSPGILAGRQMDAYKAEFPQLFQANKSHIANQLDAIFAEAVDPGRAPEPRGEVPSDAQLREDMQSHQQLDLPAPRFSVDLARAEAPQRLLIADALERAGVPCVAFGDQVEAPEGFATGGKPDPQALAPDVLVLRFLQIRDSLGTPPQRDDASGGRHV